MVSDPAAAHQHATKRIVNGGGRINREYGLGRRRTDLFPKWPVSETGGYHGEVQRVVLELKILRKSLEATLAEGLEQTADYANKCKAEEAHLPIFDHRENILWEEKIWQHTENSNRTTISAWGM